MNKKVITIFGTRPELIKLSGVIRILNNDKDIDHKICSTGQHKELIEDLLEFYNFNLDYDCKVMEPNQKLTNLVSKILNSLSVIFDSEMPDLIIVHGDTATTLAASLAGFFEKIPIVHVEAGLRTHNISSPFPEEANRIITDRLSSLYFPPTDLSFNNLVREGLGKHSIRVTGNTAIDSLLHTKNLLKDDFKVENFPKEGKVILVTAHRRESHGLGIERICKAIKELCESSLTPNVKVFWPVHPNPNIKNVVHEKLKNIDKVILSPPLKYEEFVWAMDNSYIILTDSGGVQEEAPSLNKPVLVMRDQTERPEGITAGCLKMVGTNYHTIKKETFKLLMDKNHYDIMATSPNPYGDGKASEKIVETIKRYINLDI